MYTHMHIYIYIYIYIHIYIYIYHVLFSCNCENGPQERGDASGGFAGVICKCVCICCFFMFVGTSLTVQLLLWWAARIPTRVFEGV